MEWGEFQRLAADLHNLTQHSAPYRTGNLALNAVRLRYRQVDGHNEAHITADMKIAPYMPYTNEPWVSPRWRGRRNPNQYWWDRTANYARKIIERRTGSFSRQIFRRTAAPSAAEYAERWNVTQDQTYYNSLFIDYRGGFLWSSTIPTGNGTFFRIGRDLR